MHVAKLSFLNFCRCSHHNILCILVHRERNDLTDAFLSCNEHHHTVYTRSDTSVGRCSVAECIVHSREFCFHILLAKTNDVECFDHNLRIVVTNSTGRKLNAVTYQIILICQNIQRILVFQSVKSTLRHRERVMAELQLAGLLTDLVHREVYDPAELIAVLLHVSVGRCTQHLSEHAGGLLSSL